MLPYAPCYVSCIVYHILSRVSRLVFPADTLTLRCTLPSQVEKALACVNAIGDLGKDLTGYLEKVQPAISFAKVHIFVHDKDRDAAERALWDLLKLPKTQFETAISAVKMFIDSADKYPGHEATIAQIYKFCAQKYPE
mmetsp:Transcript_4090/g.8972  ORF Transcript_4090/g.8972 Transcript_4090/m.8972 type:complete len:138 (+) Transcript_4090:580-993(+)